MVIHPFVSFSFGFLLPVDAFNLVRSRANNPRINASRHACISSLALSPPSAVPVVGNWPLRHKSHAFSPDVAALARSSLCCLLVLVTCSAAVIRIANVTPHSARATHAPMRPRDCTLGIRVRVRGSCDYNALAQR